MLFPQQFADRGDEQRVARHGLGGGEEEVLLAFDQAGVEIGAGEGRAGDQAREEVDVVRHADHLVVGQRLAHARQRARRGVSSQTISLAIIGS